MNLPAATSEDYKKQNRDAVLNYVLPAFTFLSDGLQNLRDTGNNKRGLCYLPDGKKYYELSVKEQTGSARTIPQLQKLAQRQIQSDLLTMQKLLNNSSFHKNSEAHSALYKVPRREQLLIYSKVTVPNFLLMIRSTF